MSPECVHRSAPNCVRLFIYDSVCIYTHFLLFNTDTFWCSVCRSFPLRGFCTPFPVFVSVSASTSTPPLPLPPPPVCLPRSHLEEKKHTFGFLFVFCLMSRCQRFTVRFFLFFFPPCVCNHDKDCLVTRPPSLIHPVCSDRTPRCCSCRIIECRFPFRVLAFSRVKAAAMLMAFRGRGRSKTQP